MTGVIGADHAEGSVFGDGQTVVAAHGVALEKLDPRHELNDLELFNLVIEAADLRLFKLHPPQFFGLLVAEPIDALDGFGPIGHGGVAEFFETTRRGGHRVIDRAENAPVTASRRALTGAYRSATQLGQHFLHDLSNSLFVGLDHPEASLMFG